jgi:putative transposase
MRSSNHIESTARRAAAHLIDRTSACCEELCVSERRACRVFRQQRLTQREVPRGQDDEERPTADIIELARRYGRYGYRKIAALLREAGWPVNDKRVERIWRRKGLKLSI